MDAGRRQDPAGSLGEGEQDGVVEQAGAERPGDQHQEGEPGDVQAVRPGRRHALHGREDDVRPEAEGDGQADLGRAEEGGYSEEVHGRSSRDGLLQVQV